MDDKKLARFVTLIQGGLARLYVERKMGEHDVEQVRGVLAWAIEELGGFTTLSPPEEDDLPAISELTRYR
jgi:hypothetical protein